MIKDFCSVFNTITMKNTKFYPSVWQPIPFNFDWNTARQYEKEEILELQLFNNFINARDVASMDLNINTFALISSDGSEHKLKVFLKPIKLELRGLDSGLFIQTKDIIELPKGTFSAIKFYLEERGNSFRNSKRENIDVTGLDSLEFNIKNELKIDSTKEQRLVLKFDLKSYTFKSFFKQFFKRKLFGALDQLSFK